MGTDCPGLSQYCILADGRITALAGYDSFKQFDGKTWRPMKSAEASKLGMNLETYALIPAQKGWTLALMGQREKDFTRDHVGPATEPFLRS